MSAGPAASDGVLILMSSYNGARFIAEQIESIRRQTLEGWSLLVRDDGSVDDTVRLVEAAAAADARIALLRDNRGNLGPAQSFGVLMSAALEAGVSYVALADQDDVWQADKLEQELKELRAREAVAGSAVPLLVHSDLSVVDHQLRVIHRSFLAFQRLEPRPGTPLHTLLTQNFVTGSTTVANRALLRAALPLPEVVMHDWWLALCAAALGEIVYWPQPTVLYRQHDRNAAGSRSWMGAGTSAALHPVRWWRKSLASFSATVTQACALADRIGREAGAGSPRPDSLTTIREYTGAFSAGTGALRRLWTVWRNGVRPRSILGYPVFFYARVLLWPGGVASPSGAHR